MSIFGHNWVDEDKEESSIGFGSFRSPSLKERYLQLTGDNTEGLSKKEMIKRLERYSDQGFESLRTIKEMNKLKSEIENNGSN